MKESLFIFLGGGIGSVLRYALFLLIPTTTFPYATFIVNIVGSFFIGFLVSISNMQSTLFANNPVLLLFATTGLCGGFTTFSTFSKESFSLIEQQQWTIFFAYTILSVMGCIGATALGFYIGK